MKNEIIVQKLAAYAEKIIRYCEDTDYVRFSADSKLVEACVFNLSQMGELANRVDADYAQAHQQVPWRLLYGLRNRIVHDYEGVNLQLIWEIIEDDLPVLLDELTKLS
ncbi:MAG: DUF86 domain-containing protein [Firmicutes bacterium]|nr:DUF86 domain-containing protein [Bacillota bacterium]